MTAAIFIDTVALIQMIKSGGLSTLGSWILKKHFDLITASLGSNGCQRVDAVFDRYEKISIKVGERNRRGASTALEIKIQGRATPIPKQWQKYIANPKK